jgi:hypothetical protein
MWNFTLFLIALLLWAIGLFLVNEAAKTQRWALGGPGGMPEPYSGVAMSQLLSCLFILLWLVRIYVLSRPSMEPVRFITQLFASPEQLTPGLLLAVFPPLIVGFVKLLTALTVSHGEMETKIERQNRLAVTSVFIMVHLVIAAATATILIRGFFSS